MKWTSLLTLVLIGFVAGDGAWKQNQEYKYKFLTRTLSALPRSNNEWAGAVFRGHLSIFPQSENHLIGKLSDAEYAQVQLSNGWDSDLDDNELSYQQPPEPLYKPFEIHFRNGVISSLSVDRAMTSDHINQLKMVVSQFQVNTNDQQNDNESESDSDNDSYKRMEQTITGNCENNYEVSPLPDYLIQANPDLCPMPELKDDGQIINMVKTRNYRNCDQRVGLMNSENTNQMDNEVTRIIIAGSSKRYTIQSSVTTAKQYGRSDSNNPKYVSYARVKLESIERNPRRPQIQSRNLLNTGNLVYAKSFDSQNTYERQDSGNNNQTPPQSNGIHPNPAFIYRPKSETSETNQTPLRAGLASFPDFGCKNGYCWAYCIGAVPWWGVEWCWTYKPETSGYRQCSSDSDCGFWRCSGPCAAF